MLRQVVFLLESSTIRVHSPNKKTSLPRLTPNCIHYRTFKLRHCQILGSIVTRRFFVYKTSYTLAYLLSKISLK